METKKCLNCSEPVKGRADKKFCDDQCRSAYNNRINLDSSATVKNINQFLKKNRRILHHLLATSAEGKLRINGKKLHDVGYNFNYHTHTYKTRTGNTYFFCYEYAYLPLGNDTYMLVRQGEG